MSRLGAPPPRPGPHRDTFAGMTAPLSGLLALSLALQPGPDAAAEPEPAEAQPEGPAPLDREVPTPAPPIDAKKQLDREAWEQEERRLKLHAGLSGGFAGAMVVTITLLLVVPGHCSDPNPDFGCGEGIGPAIAGITLIPLTAIPISTGIYWGVRLHRHRKQRPTARLRPGLGGLKLEF